MRQYPSPEEVKMTEGAKLACPRVREGMYELVLALLLIYMILDKLERRG